MNVRDEVCGMEFPAEQAVAKTKYGGKVYYFCAERCKRLFQENPHWFVPTRQRTDPGT